MSETPAGLWTSGLWLFGALAVALLLADLVALAFGRRMLNPRRLTDCKYRRLRRRLIFEGVLAKDATYEPRAVGTLAGHWRSIQGWSVIWSAAIGALLMVAIIAATFAIPTPFPVAGIVDVIGLHLAVGFWLALGLQGFSLLIGNSIGYRIATRRIATFPSDAGNGTTPEATRATPRRRRWISLIITVIVIAADVAITLLFAQTASTQTGSSAVELAWLSQLLLAFPPLMVLALVLGELWTLRITHRRPLLLSTDVTLARRAYARVHEQSLVAATGFATASVSGVAMAQYGVMLMFLLWRERVSAHTDFLFAFPYIFAYLAVAIVCIFTGTIVRGFSTYRAQPQATTPPPRRPAGSAAG